MKRWATLLLCFACHAAAAPSVDENSLLVDEHLGEMVPLELPLTDSDRRPAHLADLLRPGRPLVLMLVYHRCPMLCSLITRGLGEALRASGLGLGRDYEVATVSFDPQDDPAVTEAARRRTLQALDIPDTAHWRFFVATPDAIERLTSAVGFRAVRDPKSGLYAHNAVAFLLSGEGRITRYLYGADFAPRDLRLAIVEASRGRVGTTVDRVLLLCYRFDPASRRYRLFVERYFQIGGLLTFMALAGLLVRLWRRDMRRP